MIDLLGLMGDASDNIPGCPGVGEKTAQKLLTEFGSIENLLAHTEQLTGSLKTKIVENEDKIRFSKFLATIVTDVPVCFDADACVRKKPDITRLTAIYTELEFRSFITKLSENQLRTDSKTNTIEISGQFNDLFGQNSDVSGQGGTQLGQRSERSSQKGKMEVRQKPAMPRSLFDEMEMEGGNQQKQVMPLALSDEKSSQEDLLSSELTNSSGYSDLDDLTSTPHDYYLADNEEKITVLVHLLEKQSAFAFDTETDGTDPVAAKLVGMSFAIKELEAWYVPVPEAMPEALKIVSRFSDVLQNKDIEKIGQNIKFDILVLRKYGIRVRGRLFDTMIAHYLMNPELRHGMDYLAETYLKYRPVPIESLIGPKGKNQRSMRHVAIDKVAEYAAEDADVTLRLKNFFEPKLKEFAVESLFFDIEAPLVYVLAEMEYTGVKLDTDALKSYSLTLTEKLLDLEREIYALAGQVFNINSTKQVGDVLFKSLKITEDKVKKTKTGGFSTNEETLEKLRHKHPVIEKLLDYRGVKKLLSTYIDALPALINPETGKVHTSFNQTVTSTGRLSSTNPNLQNIPVRDDMGREIRKAFIPDNEDCIFFSVDYSQIELRIMAHLSGDSQMIDAFNHGADIHAATAAKIYDVSNEHVTSDMRRKAKTANFGIIYGISGFGLAERLNIPRSEAKKLIDGYFKTYPRVQEYMNESIRNAYDKGYVETLYHRRRYLPDIQSNNANVRGYAERNAINAPIQGSAADIIKVAMVRIHQRFESENLKSKMIMQVHDELNFNVYKEEMEQVRRIVLDEMEGAIRLKVPLIADCGVGSNWLEAH
jgi:DNA polymerase-1